MKAFFLLLLLASCAHGPEKKFQKLLQSGKCEEASINLPHFKAKKASAQIASVPGKTASYILTSAAYGADLVFFVTKGLILPSLACSP